ncbi:glycosyltransferase family 2 protein [Bradyrhizobium jicamae]|uniref:Glycosyltransferase family 2 protein n=1 Tax=Bradyrhizobium jicamae TaxID=280332 RepID=A0ABS5FK52_9BRAD|nr:glycosyltransferase family A protein [Bradyrhizobium jicamae]MBR0797158.1 glycosyltransferase family 2 protein [Bradyrhizobium jicamae]MBR0934929.1 glycosyltransferase family 2 protein [Bradyrhizobium jicamae]
MREDQLSGELTLSVVIPNYNYARYVGTAIQSALDIRWPRVEVVVVDDGSTDNSMEVISAFADRIVAVSQTNVGQMQSCVNGFRRSTGDVVIFLDSDDALHPDIMREVAAAWSEKASKFQFQMRAIDAAGHATGSVQPQFFETPTPQQIREWAITAGVYPTPPGSGNAYPRWLVEKVFNFKSDFVDRAPDSYLVTAAPALGDVITIAKPLVDYRVHGENHGAFLQLDDSRFAREVDVTRRRFNFFTEIARSVGLAVDPEALSRNMLYLCLRAASYALQPNGHPIEQDSSMRIMADSFRALGYPQGFTISQRASLFLWTLCVLFGPGHLSRSLVSWRYAPTSRPRLMKTALNLFKVVR